LALPFLLSSVCGWCLYLWPRLWLFFEGQAGSALGVAAGGGLVDEFLEDGPAGAGNVLGPAHEREKIDRLALLGICNGRHLLA